MIFQHRSLAIVFFSCLFLAIASADHRNNSNICNWIKCANGGTCQNILNLTLGYHCRCPFGFTGLLCEDRLNLITCMKNPCLNNGNCTITNNRFVKCICSKQYTGVHCENFI